jgi:hypothetical protein
VGDNTAVIRFRRAALLLTACVLAPSVLRAHEVPVEQRVEMAIERQADRLIVRMRLPASLVGNGPIQAAADDLARNLDVRQHDVALARPSVAAVRGIERPWTDVEFTYRINAAENGISARLNGFQAPPMQPVRTTVRYALPNGASHIVSIVGPATRVNFDPGALEVAQDFVARALRAVLTVGDHLLLLACLLLPLRSARSAATLFAMLALGQLVGFTAFTFFGFDSRFAISSSMIGASAVVCAAVQNMVNAREKSAAALAVGFGVLNGVAFADLFGATRQFAGTHQTLAFAIVLVMIAAGELWLGAVMWATRSWLDRQGTPPRMFAIVASAIIVHTAIHEIFDRGEALAADGTIALDRALLWLALAWVMIMLGAAALQWLRQTRSPTYAIPR